MLNGNTGEVQAAALVLTCRRSPHRLCLSAVSSSSDPYEDDNLRHIKYGYSKDRQHRLSDATKINKQSHERMTKNSPEDVICIICARGGSKGLSRKNLTSLEGIPLVARPIRDALTSGAVGTVLVTTDDEEIAAAARAAGAVAPFLRPAELAQDTTTTEETLQHALVTYEALIGRKFEIAVFLTATDIFRDPSWIQAAVNILRSRPELESVFSGHSTYKNFWEQEADGSWVRVKPWMAVYSSRQVRRRIVREDTGLTCASRAWLWREGRRIGDRVEIMINDDAFTSIDIHSEEDLQLARAAIRIRRSEHVSE